MKVLIEDWRQYLTEFQSNRIIAILGPSGSGKSRQKNIFKQYGWQELVSLVTRPPRSEVDVEYEFTTKEEWLKKYEAGKLVNINEYSGNFYGTKLEDLVNAKKAILVTDETNIDGSRGENDLKKIAKKYDKDLIIVFSMPPEKRELERRHKKRLNKGEYKSEKELQIRLLKAKEEAENIKQKIKALDAKKFSIYNDDDAKILAQKLN